MFFHNVLCDGPHRLLTCVLPVIIPIIVCNNLPSGIDVSRVVTGTTGHCEAPCVTNRRKLGSLTANIISTLFSVGILRNYEVISTNNISVPTCSVGCKSSSFNCSVTDTFLLTLGVVYHNGGTTPLLSFTYVRLDVLRPVLAEYVTTQNILNVIQLSFCQLCCSRYVEDGDLWVTYNHPSSPCGYHVGLEVCSWEHNEFIASKL